LEDGRILCPHVQRLNQPQLVVSKVALLEGGGKFSLDVRQKSRVAFTGSA